MSIHEQVVNDWKTALKNKDERKNALSMIISEFKNKAINDPSSQTDGRMVSDEAALEVLQKMSKQRKESIESFQQAGRNELVEKESLELSVIESYLPKPLSQEELKSIVENAIAELGATSMKEMGKVMALAIKNSKARANGKDIQNMVTELLKG